MIRTCDECGTHRAAELETCPTCQARRDAQVCRCGQSAHTGLCPHCDRTCQKLMCRVCTATKTREAEAAAAMRTLPYPTVRQLEEPVRGPAIGRCPSCDGRTYDDWCPRAFCGKQREDA